MWQDLPCGGEAVVSLIDDVFSENFTGLFCDTLSKELVVDLYAWDVTLVAWNNRVVPHSWSLYFQIKLINEILFSFQIG